MKKILIILMVVFILSGCDNKETNEPIATNKTDEPSNACSIDEPCDDSKITNTKDGLKWDILTLKEANENLDGTKVLFFSFETCPYCILARPILEEVMEANEDIKIYYVDVMKEERSQDNEAYVKMLEYLKPKLAEEYSEKIYMPTIAFIKDGELVATYTGNYDEDGDEKSYTSNEKVKQAEIYQELIDLLK